MIAHFPTEREWGLRTVGKSGVDLWLAFRDAFARALRELDDEVVEFGLAVEDVRDDLFVLVC